jgi:uncharacterized membrane protein YsdA (DUF1294 family)
VGLEVGLLLFLAFWVFNGLVIGLVIFRFAFPWGFKWLCRTVRLALFLFFILLLTTFFVKSIFFPLINALIGASRPTPILLLIWMLFVFMLSFPVRQSALAIQSYSSASSGQSEELKVSGKANATARYFSLVSILLLLTLCLIQVLLVNIVPKLLYSYANDVRFHKFVITLFFFSISLLISLFLRYRLHLLRFWRQNRRLAWLRATIVSIYSHEIIINNTKTSSNVNVKNMTKFDKLITFYGMLSVLANLAFIALLTLSFYGIYADRFFHRPISSVASFVAISYFYSINVSTFFLYGIDSGHAWLFEKEQDKQRKSSSINIGSHWAQRLARAYSVKFALVNIWSSNRMPENILHWHSALGGSIGAYAGHWFFNHKKMFAIFQNKSDSTSKSIMKFAPVYERIVFSQILLLLIMAALRIHSAQVS